MRSIFVITLLWVSGAGVLGQGRLVYGSDFRNNADLNEWIVEVASEKDSAVYVRNGSLVIDSKDGITVWLNKRLEGNIQIEYERTVLVDDKKNDRLSDLNQFWMAQDPRSAEFFTRKGAFEEYDSLQLYYAGMGGNTNTTTRFRKYDGKGNRVRLQEYTDEKHLLKPNRKYKIRIIVQDGTTSFWVDGECYFRYSDPEPLRKGYFGFRSVHSRQQVSAFRIYRLP